MSNTVKPVLGGHSKRRPKIGFQDQLSRNAGQKYCRMLQYSKWSILQYVRPSLSYHVSLRSLFCLSMNDRLRQVLLYLATKKECCSVAFSLLLSTELKFDVNNYLRKTDIRKCFKAQHRFLTRLVLKLTFQNPRSCNSGYAHTVSQEYYHILGHAYILAEHLGFTEVILGLSLPVRPCLKKKRKKSVTRISASFILMH